MYQQSALFELSTKQIKVATIKYANTMTFVSEMFFSFNYRLLNWFKMSIDTQMKSADYWYTYHIWIEMFNIYLWHIFLRKKFIKFY